jgi:hypothetical protein
MTLKRQRNAEYAKHTNDPVLSSLKMEGIRLLFNFIGHFIAFHSAHDTHFAVRKAVDVHKCHGNSWM